MAYQGHLWVEGSLGLDSLADRLITFVVSAPSGELLPLEGALPFPVPSLSNLHSAFRPFNQRVQLIKNPSRMANIFRAAALASKSLQIGRT